MRVSFIKGYVVADRALANPHVGVAAISAPKNSVHNICMWFSRVLFAIRNCEIELVYTNNDYII